MSIQNRQTQPVAVIGGMRIPFCKMGTNYADLSLLDLMSASMKALVDKYGLNGQKLDDVMLGAVFAHPQFWNLAREAVLDSGLSPETPAMGNQRACATSLDAAINVASKIALGQMESGAAGGAEAMSDPTIFLRRTLAKRMLLASQAKTWTDKLKAWKGLRFSDMKPTFPPATERTTGKSMGEHCEIMVKQWKISREEQDEIALRSHLNAANAFERGFYNDLVIPFRGAKADNTVRKDTSMERLAKLRPAFDSSGLGSLTAGNSSPFTDGSAAVLLGSENWAKSRGLSPMAFLTEYEVAAIDMQREGLLMAPVYAVPRMLKRAGLTLQDFDFYEIHEAFAGQVACTLKAWESETYCKDKLGLRESLGSIPRDKLNVAGGSVALGHPFAATGARMIATMAKLLKDKGSGRGLLSICAGGGMGTVAILER